MLKKILVPIAFSSYSESILDYALRLAKPYGAKLLIVNVISEKSLEAVEKISSHGYKIDGDKYVATIQEERIALFEGMVERLGMADDAYDYKLLAGDPAMELLRLVLDEKVDLVIMGTKTRELRHIFTGSVAERMFRRCPVPILSYRGGDVAKQLRQRAQKDIDQ
ncbi:MAG: universal stress protein [Desulfocapsaceae bacterium]|nr:universal stress protein [Desulfocapsaceae bacterium]